MVTVYTWGVYAVVKNQKFSLPSWLITCANVKKEKNCVQLLENHGRLLGGTYLGVRAGLFEATWAEGKGERMRCFTEGTAGKGLTL